MQGPPIPASDIQIGNPTSGSMFPAKLLLYVLILLLGFIGPFLFKLRTDGIFACPADGYTGNRYLAYCHVTGYGDYDHSAFWFGLEPEIERFAVEAEVLFLGNSRMQFAFSSQATHDWFSSFSIRYYLLGFSSTENISFTAPLLSKLHPRAKVIVINVDRFFEDKESDVGAAILRGGDVLLRSKEKRFWQIFHKPICTQLPMICGKAVSFFRTRETGAWHLNGFRLWEESKAVADGPASDTDRWNIYAELGKQFLSQLPIRQDCVLLTIAPSNATKMAEATAIANSLNLDLLVPLLDGLQTFDGSHLDRPSAERWSRAFFDTAGPRIRACLHEAHRATRSIN